MELVAALAAQMEPVLERMVVRDQARMELVVDKMKEDSLHLRMVRYQDSLDS
jgi:hypothetical protein